MASLRADQPSVARRKTARHFPSQRTARGNDEQWPPAYKAYFDELNRLGFIEGQNLIVERYSGLGQPDRYGDFARQIVASHPDVILPFSAVFIKEIKALTTGIPMVGPTADPVALGLSTNLARPDGNFTGVVD